MFKLISSNPQLRLIDLSNVIGDFSSQDYIAQKRAKYNNNNDSLGDDYINTVYYIPHPTGVSCAAPLLLYTNNTRRGGKREISDMQKYIDLFFECDQALYCSMKDLKFVNSELSQEAINEDIAIEEAKDETNHILYTEEGTYRIPYGKSVFYDEYKSFAEEYDLAMHKSYDYLSLLNDTFGTGNKKAGDNITFTNNGLPLNDILTLIIDGKIHTDLKMAIVTIKPKSQTEFEEKIVCLNKDAAIKIRKGNNLNYTSLNSHNPKLRTYDVIFFTQTSENQPQLLKCNYHTIYSLKFIMKLNGNSIDKLSSKKGDTEVTKDFVDDFQTQYLRYVSEGRCPFKLFNLYETCPATGRCPFCSSTSNCMLHIANDLQVVTLLRKKQIEITLKEELTEVNNVHIQNKSIRVGLDNSYKIDGGVVYINDIFIDHYISSTSLEHKNRLNLLVESIETLRPMIHRDSWILKLCYEDILKLLSETSVIVGDTTYQLDPHLKDSRAINNHLALRNTTDLYHRHSSVIMLRKLLTKSYIRGIYSIGGSIGREMLKHHNLFRKVLKDISHQRGCTLSFTSLTADDNDEWKKFTTVLDEGRDKFEIREYESYLFQGKNTYSIHSDKLTDIDTSVSFKNLGFYDGVLMILEIIYSDSAILDTKEFPYIFLLQDSNYYPGVEQFTQGLLLTAKFFEFKIKIIGSGNIYGATKPGHRNEYFGKAGQFIVRAGNDNEPDHLTVHMGGPSTKPYQHPITQCDVVNPLSKPAASPLKLFIDYKWDVIVKDITNKPYKKHIPPVKLNRLKDFIKMNLNLVSTEIYLCPTLPIAFNGKPNTEKSNAIAALACFNIELEVVKERPIPLTQHAGDAKFHAETAGLANYERAIHAIQSVKGSDTYFKGSDTLDKANETVYNTFTSNKFRKAIRVNNNIIHTFLDVLLDKDNGLINYGTNARFLIPLTDITKINTSKQDKEYTEAKKCTLNQLTASKDSFFTKLKILLSAFKRDGQIWPMVGYSFISNAPENKELSYENFLKAQYDLNRATTIYHRFVNPILSHLCNMTVLSADQTIDIALWVLDWFCYDTKEQESGVLVSSIFSLLPSVCGTFTNGLIETFISNPANKLLNLTTSILKTAANTFSTTKDYINILFPGGFGFAETDLDSINWTNIKNYYNSTLSSGFVIKKEYSFYEKVSTYKTIGDLLNGMPSGGKSLDTMLCDSLTTGLALTFSKEKYSMFKNMEINALIPVYARSKIVKETSLPITYESSSDNTEKAALIVKNYAVQSDSPPTNKINVPRKPVQSQGSELISSEQKQKLLPKTGNTGYAGGLTIIRGTEPDYRDNTFEYKAISKGHFNSTLINNLTVNFKECKSLGDFITKERNTHDYNETVYPRTVGFKSDTYMAENNNITKCLTLINRHGSTQTLPSFESLEEGYDIIDDLFANDTFDMDMVLYDSIISFDDYANRLGRKGKTYKKARDTFLQNLIPFETVAELMQKVREVLFILKKIRGRNIFNPISKPKEGFPKNGVHPETHKAVIGHISHICCNVMRNLSNEEKYYSTDSLSNFIYLPALTGEEIKNKMDALIDRFCESNDVKPEDVLFLPLDITKMDSCRVETREFENRFVRKLFYPLMNYLDYPHAMWDNILENCLATKIKYTARDSDRNIKFFGDVTGTVLSGFPLHTTFGNTLTMFILYKMIEKEVGYNNVIGAAAGDNLLLCCTKSKLQNVLYSLNKRVTTQDRPGRYGLGLLIGDYKITTLGTDLLSKSYYHGPLGQYTRLEPRLVKTGDLNFGPVARTPEGINSIRKGILGQIEKTGGNLPTIPNYLDSYKELIDPALTDVTLPEEFLRELDFKKKATKTQENYLIHMECNNDFEPMIFVPNIPDSYWNSEYYNHLNNIKVGVEYHF